MSGSASDKGDLRASSHDSPIATSLNSAPGEGNFNSSSLLVAANACMFVFGAVLLLMGSLLPSLQVSYAQAGNLGAFPLAGILVATVLVGPILDLIGAKPVLAVALALVSVSVALLPALDSYSALAGSAFAYGLGGGLLNTAANALVADLSAAGRAAALNLLGFFFSLGAISAPLALSSLGGNFSARMVLRGLAILCLLILALVVALRFPPAARAGTRLRNLLAVLRHPAIWLLAALLFFESGNENCMFVWAGKIVADTLHVLPRQANMALVALSAALAAGRLMAVLWLKWIGNRGTIWLSTALVIAGSLVAMNSTHLAGTVAGMLVIGLGLSAIYPTALGIASDLFPAETGTVFGAIMAVALVGGTAGPKIAGWAASHGAGRVLLIPVVAAAAVAALTALMGRCNGHRLRSTSA
jgi:fucose permease